jgi:predicted nucleic acid-binding protein
VSDLVLDASLALQWFLEDETNREYSLGVLASLSERRALVPLIWFYEIGNGLVMAYRRKRISPDQIDGFLAGLRLCPLMPQNKRLPRFSTCRPLRSPTA